MGSETKIGFNLLGNDLILYPVTPNPSDSLTLDVSKCEKILEMKKEEDFSRSLPISKATKMMKNVLSETSFHTTFL